jgi:hypothetical protein
MMRSELQLAEHSLIEHLEARQLLATIGWDGGGDGTTLNDPANWAGDVLPGPSDDAIIGLASSPTISFSSGTFTVHSLTCTEAFNMSGGTLNVATASTFSGALFMSGGVITGLGAITIEGPFTWDAGTLTGAGATTIGSASVVTMNTAGTRTLSRSLTNNGRINHSAGVFQFAGSGTLNNSAGQVYNMMATASMLATGANNTFNNAGVFNDQTASTISLNLVFNNSGQLNVYGGVLNLDGGGTNTGTRNLAAGAVLNYRAGYTHAAGSNLAGSGTMNFAGGTQIISGNWTSNARLQLLSGTLDGSGNLTTNAPLIWGAGTMTGSGNVTIMPGGKLALTTGAAHVLSRDIVNNGNLHFLNGVLTMAGALITNAATGTFAALPTATIAASAGINGIDNDGLFKKMGPGTITFDSALGGVRMNNTGTVDVRNGVLNLNGPVSQLVGDALNGGTWQLYPSATLSLGPTDILSLGNTTIVNLVGGGAMFLNISTLNTNHGTINLSLGGIYQINPAGGTFTNNGTIDLAHDRWLRINGNYLQSAAGRLNLDLFSATRYSRVFAVGGAAALAGTAAFELVGGFTPSSPITFNFLHSSGVRTGTFDSTITPTLPSGTATVAYIPNGANLVVA